MPWGSPTHYDNPTSTPDGSLEDSHLVSLEDTSTIASETAGGVITTSTPQMSSATVLPPRVNQLESPGTPDLEKRGKAVPRSQRAMKRQRSLVSADEDDNDGGSQGDNNESSSRSGSRNSIAMDPDVISATPQSVLGTAQQILSEPDHQEDFSVMAPDAPFSRENMADALRNLSPHLDPSPTNEDIENCNYDKFKIVVDKRAEFVGSILRKDNADSMELMLLAVKSIIKSKPAVKKKLLQLKPLHQMRTAGQYIFKN